MVEDAALSLLWHRFSHWPGNFHMPPARLRGKKKKKKKVLHEIPEIFNLRVSGMTRLSLLKE